MTVKFGASRKVGDKTKIVLTLERSFSTLTKAKDSATILREFLGEYGYARDDYELKIIRKSKEGK